jgi:hypothetical protein
MKRSRLEMSGLDAEAFANASERRRRSGDRPSRTRDPRVAEPRVERHRDDLDPHGLTWIFRASREIIGALGAGLSLRTLERHAAVNGPDALDSPAFPF